MLLTKYQSKGSICTLAATGRLFVAKGPMNDSLTKSIFGDVDKSRPTLDARNVYLSALHTIPK